MTSSSQSSAAGGTLRRTQPSPIASPAQFDREHTVGTRPTSAIEFRDHIWVVVKLDYQMHGQIAVDDGGHFYFEGDLSLPKWQQGSACSHSLARLIERAFQLAQGDIVCRLRVIQVEGDEVNPQILLASKTECKDADRLKAVMHEFASQLSLQRELPHAHSPREVDSTTREQVTEVASQFLQSYGGQSVQRQIQLCVEGADIATITGQWKTSQPVEAMPPVTHDLMVWFDGRRLRTRVLFVVVTEPFVKGMEIGYEDERFDEPLRQLEDNKSAILEIKVLEEFSAKGKSSYRLLEMRRFAPPEELELRPPPG